MTTPLIPPPWTLRGRGYVLLYWFSEAWARQYAHLADWQRADFRAGLGAVMLVDYAESGVGPYQELLLIPGRARVGRKRRFSISKIYVSTEASTGNGRKNWGIPKETARFDWQPAANGGDTVTVCVGERVAFSATLRAGGLSFPLTTALLPFTIGQRLDGETFLTRPCATGWAKPARLIDLQTDPDLFPNLSDLKPLAVLALRDFQMTFPFPEIQP